MSREKSPLRIFVEVTGLIQVGTSASVLLAVLAGRAHVNETTVVSFQADNDPEPNVLIISDLKKKEKFEVKVRSLLAPINDESKKELVSESGSQPKDAAGLPPEASYVMWSPNGKWVAYLDKEYFLVVQPAHLDQDSQRHFFYFHEGFLDPNATILDKDEVVRYRWTRDGKYLIIEDERQALSNWFVSAFDPENNQHFSLGINIQRKDIDEVEFK